MVHRSKAVSSSEEVEFGDKTQLNQMSFRSRALIENRVVSWFSRRKPPKPQRYYHAGFPITSTRPGNIEILPARESSVDDDRPGLESSFELSLDSDRSRLSLSDNSDCEPSTGNDKADLPKLVAVKKESDVEDALGRSFSNLRVTYLLVTLVIMLADGLQGTHLYVLYESYGYSVASLYCLGFLSGGLMSPVTGPLVDRMGRKKAAILYCLLEIFINWLEQYPYFVGLVASRMIGGFTTNLLCQVFEAWLDSEYRTRGLAKEKYEIIMRDSVIVSNLAAIFSGYLAHVLAEVYGARGPFRGAVSCTGIALLVVLAVWNENFGSEDDDSGKDMTGYFQEAVAAFRSDGIMLRVGIMQGLSAGSIQIFIFLWAPALRDLARCAVKSTVGLDSQGEPAYGIIFGAFMAAGVLGGIVAPPLRRIVTNFLSVGTDSDDVSLEMVEVDGEVIEVRPMAVEFVASVCYLLSSTLLMVPCLVSKENSHSFSICLSAFLAFELLIGVLLPCEGVIRSLYYPAAARASVMGLPRIIVNGVVAAGVASTTFLSLQTAFAAVAIMMVASATLQLTLISTHEWSSIWSRLYPSNFALATRCCTSRVFGLFPGTFGCDPSKVKTN